MKITVEESAPVRQLVGVINKEGKLMLRDTNKSQHYGKPINNTYCFDGNTVQTNGSMTIDEMYKLKPKCTPIYKGDKVTIQF